MSRPRGVTRPKAELEKELTEQLQLLGLACKSYDGGFEASGKHIALSVRLLVHHHGTSKALLEQLGMRSMPFHDSAGPLNPRNLMAEHNLVMIRMTNEGARYIPILSDSPQPVRPVRFLDWWNNPVLKDQAGMTFCRRELILHVADTDGGAHVDSELDAQYMALSRANSLGWQFSANNIVKALEGRPELACIRQIAHELLGSIRQSAPQFLD
jgi:hypothetical protein